MKNRLLKRMVTTALGFGTIGIAHADDGLYLGGNLGAPHFQSNINGVLGNGSGLSGKLYGGYQFTPNFALETGMAYLGHVNGTAGNLNGRSEFLDAVGLAPLNNQWSLLGRIGLAHVNLDTSNGNGDGNGLKLGLGTQYSITKSVAVRGEWEYYRPNVFGYKPDLSQFTLGVRFGF